MNDGILTVLVNQILSDDFAEIDASDGLRQFIKRVKILIIL